MLLSGVTISIRLEMWQHGKQTGEAEERDRE